MGDSSKLEKITGMEEGGVQHEVPVFDFSYIPEFPKDEAHKKAYENMQKATEIYRGNPSQTLRLQITEQAFNRLKNRQGMKGAGYSHTKEVIAGDEMEYYLVVSPYTNVDQIRKSNNPKQKALTLAASYYSTQTDEEDVNFELTEITANGTASIDDRSEVYPKDILKIDFISAPEAEEFIKTQR